MSVPVRPTLRVLRLLPPESYASAPILSTLDRARATSDSAERRALLDTLHLGELDQPLLADARERFAAGMPDQHRAASLAAKRTVYEVRDMAGAGWRGAVILDTSVGWLVFADRHDRFHASAAAHLKKAGWDPTVLDRELAAADAARQGLQHWKATTLAAILDALSAATHDPSGRHTFTTPPDLTGRSCQVRITLIEQDLPADDPSSAHTSSAYLQTSVEVAATDSGLAQRVVALLGMLAHQDVPMDSAFIPGGALLVLLVLTHARLAQLSATLTSSGGKAPPLEVRSQSALHYVDRALLVNGFVNGTAVLSLCGVWFVPQRDSSASLPVCAPCESIEPAAQRLLDAMRRRP